jgi:hypothetical protein
MAMSIAVTPLVRALLRGKSAAEAPPDSGAAMAEADSPPAEVSRVRRIAWAVVLLLGWGFSYSIGWSKGWTAGAADADARFEALSQCMINLPQAQAAAEAPPDPFRMADGVETAATADQGFPADGAAGRL